MQKLIHRAMQPMVRRLANIFARGAVSLVNAGGKLQTLQLRLLAGEVKDNVEHFEPYGFTSHPLPGAEHFTAFLDGDRTHGITLVVADRRYRLQALPEGGVALYDSHGSFIKLLADGSINSKGDWSHDGSIHVTQSLIADVDVKDQGGGKSMAGMRATYNTHTHGASPGPSASM